MKKQAKQNCKPAEGRFIESFRLEMNPRQKSIMKGKNHEKSF